MSIPPNDNPNEFANSNDPNIINLRARASRIDPGSLQAFTKVPQPVKKEELLVRNGERLSRQVHLQETPAEVTIPVSQNLGHLPLKTVPKPQQLQEKIAVPPQFPHEVRREFRKKALLIATPKISVAKPVTPVTAVTTGKEKKEKSSGMKEVVKFLATSAAIFLVTLVVINFSAYWQIVEDKIFPERNIELAQNLNAATRNIPEFDRPPLLPVAGVERQIIQKFQQKIEVTPLDNRLIIPKIGKNVPIVTDVGLDALVKGDWKRLEDEIQEALRGGVVQYPGTAAPGETGNFFITGHSSYYFWDKGKYKDVFALLGKLEVGDTYTVYFNQKKYTYRINDKKIIKPEETSVLAQPTDKKISTLMTCYPPGSTLQRLIYTAEQIEE